MTHRQIINRALMALGVPAITGTIGTTDAVHVAVSAMYEGAWRDVLESNLWSDLAVQVELEPYEESLSPDEVDDVPVTDDEGRYRYTLPAGVVDVWSIETPAGVAVTGWEIDGAYLWAASSTGIVAVFVFTYSTFRHQIPSDSIKVHTILREDGKADLEAKKRGSFVYSKYETITVTYVTGDGLVPVTISSIDSSLEPVMPVAVQDAVAYRLAALIAFQITQNTDLQQVLEQRYYNALSTAKGNDMRSEGGEDFWGYGAPDPAEYL